MTGLLVLVAQPMVIQSVVQVLPTTLPAAGAPPVILNDIGVALTVKIQDFNTKAISSVLKFTCVCTSCVLDSTKVPFCPDAYGVVGIGQHETTGIVVIETKHFATDSSVVLQAAIGS